MVTRNVYNAFMNLKIEANILNVGQNNSHRYLAYSLFVDSKNDPNGKKTIIQP